jgi:hypothetical protein
MTTEKVIAKDDIDIAKSVDYYIRLRDKIKALEDEHKKKMEPFKTALEQLNTKLLGHLNAINTDSAAINGIGTVYRTQKVSATIADASEFRRFIIGGEAWDLVDWRANPKATTDFIAENGSPPPGINYSTTYVVGVRRK